MFFRILVQSERLSLRVTFTQDQFPNRDRLSHNYFERTELIGRAMTACVSISKVSGPLYWKERTWCARNQ